MLWLLSFIFGSLTCLIQTLFSVEQCHFRQLMISSSRGTRNDGPRNANYVTEFG